VAQARDRRRAAVFGRDPLAPAAREMLTSFFDYVEAELEAVNFYPEDKKPIMARNMRDIFHRLAMTEQEVRTLRGAIRALAEGRRLRKP
jgi:tRNA/rRNA methyltransferase